jgi:hypothetical protein
VKTLAINRDLILNRASDDDLAALDILYLSDPNLLILSPLAKAGYFKARMGQIPAEVANDALQTIFAIAGEDGEALRGGESIVVFVEEIVHHCIERGIGKGRMIQIGFESEGSISEFLGNSDAWLSLDELAGVRLNRESQLLSDVLLESLNRKVARRQPECYPCDTDFIGVVTYSIKTIGHVEVQGFSAVDYYNEYEIGHERIELEGIKDGRFRWIDLLTKKQKDDLGIGLAADQDDPSAWIDRQQMLDSYQDGHVKECKINCFVLTLGSGALWSPNEIDEWIHDLDSSSEDEPFHEQQSPIITYTFQNYSGQFDSDHRPALELVNALLEAVK